MPETEKVRKYDSEFTKEVYNMESGQWVKMCMQCGICPTTCTLKDQMDHSPRKLIQLIRAGAKDEVLKSNTMWLCTSCYTCASRCPRGVPMMDIMHGLCHLAENNGIITNKTHMSGLFCKDITKRGRIWEGGLTAKYGLKLGIGKAIKLAKDMQDVGMAMVKHKRISFFPAASIKGTAGLKKIIQKAEALAKEEG